MRVRISRAALLVKVTARIRWGGMDSAWMSQAIRCTSTRVLPLPAPAKTRRDGTSAQTARRCAALRGSTIEVISMLHFSRIALIG